MTQLTPQQERLLFLAKVVTREIKHLQSTDSRLFAQPLTVMFVAERLGWIKSSDSWLETRKLRNQMVHEYIEAPEVLADAINTGHQRVADLVYAAGRMLAEIDNRISNG